MKRTTLKQQSTVRYKQQRTPWNIVQSSIHDHFDYYCGSRSTSTSTPTYLQIELEQSCMSRSWLSISNTVSANTITVSGDLFIGYHECGKIRLSPFVPHLAHLQSFKYKVWWCNMTWCRETAELEDGEPIINTPPHHSRHPNWIPVKEQFWLKKLRKSVRRYDTTRLWGSTQLCRLTCSLGQSDWNQKIGKIQCVFCCIMSWNDVRYKIWCNQSTLGSPEYILPVTMSISASSLSLYSCRPSVSLHHPCIPIHPPLFSLLLSWVVVVLRNGFSSHNSSLALCVKHTCPRPSNITLYPIPKEHKYNINPKERHNRRPKGTPSTQKNTMNPKKTHILKGTT